MKPKNLEESILFTMSYFDVFEYSPTHWEIFRYLFMYKASLAQVIKELDDLIRLGKIEMQNGFYFLPEKSHLVAKRQEKYEISEKYWKKALLATKILSYLPFIKTVCVVNSLAFFNCKKDSDIDFLIISKKGKIWTTRFLSTLLMHILGLRRHGNKVTKRICLSFYISEEKMDLEYIAKDSFGFFVAFWIAQSAPLLNYSKTFENFRSENKWIYEILPNCGQNITNYYTDYDPSFLSKIISSFLEKILGFKLFEKKLKQIQLKRIRRSQEKLGNPISVIYDDYILKFHPTDSRIEYNKKIIQTMGKVID